MAQNQRPVFALTPNMGQGRTSGANAARDGSGSLVSIFTAGTNGARVDKVKWVSAQASAGASSTMVVRLFLTDNAGSNPRLLIEAPVIGTTPSTTAIGSFIVFDFVNGVTTVTATTTTVTVYNNGFIGGIVLKAGQILQLAQSVYTGVVNIDQSDVSVEGGDF